MTQSGATTWNDRAIGVLADEAAPSETARQAPPRPRASRQTNIPRMSTGSLEAPDPDTRQRLIAGVLAASLGLTLLASLAVAALVPGQGIPPAIDIIGLSSGLASCWLIRRHEIAGWYIGFVMIAAIAGSFFAYGLPGQAWFQLVYALPVQVYGCIAWSRRCNVAPEVSRLRPSGRAFVLAGFVLAAVVIAGVLTRIYGGDWLYRLWDAAIVSGAFFAQTLLARRKIESWYCWIFLVNIPGIVLYVQNGAWLYALLYSFLMWNAVNGIRDWNKSLARSPAAPSGGMTSASRS